MSPLPRVELPNQPDVPLPEILGEQSVHLHEIDALDADSSPEDFQRVIAQLQAERNRLATYARSLWELLAVTGRYLRDDIAAGAAHQSTPLHDDEDWVRWQRMYAAVLSSLAGPNGDEGHGLSEARLAAQQVRSE